MTRVPAELKYSKSHEWVRLDGDIATVGITDHAQRELTALAYVELPAVGRRFQAGDPCAVVESVKAASDVYSPISGEVIEIHATLPENAGWVNSDPYGEGWFFRLKASDAAEVAALLDATAYRALIGES